MDNKDSAQNPQDGAPPSAQVGGNGGQPGSVGAEGLQSALDTLKKEVSGLSKALSTMQSGKDRGLKEVKDRIGELEKVMHEKNVGLGEAMTIIETRDGEVEARQAILELRSYLQNNGSLPPKAGVNPKAREIVANLGLDENDPGVLQLLKDHENDPVALAVNGARLVKQFASKPTINPTSAPPSPAGAVAPKVSVNSALEAYTKEMLAARGNPALLKQVKQKYSSQEYREIGFDPEKVAFH